jgi:hypothetical protein
MPYLQKNLRKNAKSAKVLGFYVKFHKKYTGTKYQ